MKNFCKRNRISPVMHILNIHICHSVNSLLKTNFCKIAILPPNNTAVSTAITKHFMYAFPLLFEGSKITAPMIPVSRAPINKRYNSMTGIYKHMQFMIAPIKDVTRILNCVTEQARKTMVSSHMQSKNTKFKRKKYST